MLSFDRSYVRKLAKWLGDQPIYLVLYDDDGSRIGRVRCAVKIADEPDGSGLQVYKTGSLFLLASPDQGESGIFWDRPPALKPSLLVKIEREDGTVLFDSPVRLSDTCALTCDSYLSPRMTIPVDQLSLEVGGLKK